jgi:hypothetical protein
MPRGLSLHIGLNYVDPGRYSGWDGALVACENDARDIKQIASTLDYAPTLLLTRDATRDAVLNAIKNAAKELQAGDIFLLSYSGHGGQVDDMNGDEPDDGKDETWVLYDGEVVDDELHQLYTTFVSGVRIVVLSDSCHSGTVTRAAFDGTVAVEAGEHMRPTQLVRSKRIPRDIERKFQESNSSYLQDVRIERERASAKPRKQP